MPVRLLTPYNGQAVRTTFWSTREEEAQLIASGNADTQIELAIDYQQQARLITTPTGIVSRNAVDYIFTSGSAQTLTLGISGFWPMGTVVTISQLGTGAVTVAPATGVTVNTKLSSLVTGGQYSIGQLKKVGADTWLAFGGFGG